MVNKRLFPSYNFVNNSLKNLHIKSYITKDAREGRRGHVRKKNDWVASVVPCAFPHYVDIGMVKVEVTT